MKQVIIIISGLMILAFQNFTYVNWDSVKMSPINEALREKHAKELLGTEFKKISSAPTKKTKKYFSKFHQRMHSLLKENLHEKNKEKSLEITKVIIQESQKYKFDPFFVMAVIQTESNFDSDIIGQFGEIGLMQIKPDTAEWIVKKFEIDMPKHFDLKDPVTNIRIGTAYMSYLRKSFPQKPERYIAAYNMGPRNVRKLVSKNKTPNTYPDKVLENYIQIYQQITDRPASGILSMR